GRPHSLEALDLDGDGKPDLAAGLQGSGILPLRSKGDGTFQALPVATSFGCVRYIAAADLNRDGKWDLVASCTDGTATVGLSLGDGTFQKTLGVAFHTGEVSVAFADFDGDRFADLATLTTDQSQIDVYRGKGDGTFLQSQTVRTTGSQPFL